MKTYLAIFNDGAQSFIFAPNDEDANKKAATLAKERNLKVKSVELYDAPKNKGK